MWVWTCTGQRASPQWGTVDAFDAGDYDLESMRAELIEAIADTIEQIYRDAGLGFSLPDKSG